MPIHQPIISESDVVRPTQVVVNLDRLAENFRAIRAAVEDAAVMPVLKANAYGHGVAVLEEGILLRQAGIGMPILVLGGILGNQIPHFIAHELTLTASSADKLRQIDDAAASLGRRARVHLKVDTGMERIGVHHYHAEPFILAAAACRHLEVEGIYSHLANADADDLTHARLQVERFQAVLDLYGQHGLDLPRYRHLANSGAILQLPEARHNLVRPGILLYGVYPSPEAARTIPVRPALTWKSRVVYFKVIGAGDPVGYGSTWQSDHAVRAVTVPVGYGDGYFRAMSGRAQVLIRGRRYPVVGTIAMDQVVVNIEQDSAYNDDEVILLGEQGDEVITCQDLANWAGTIPYEILTNINTRVPRLYTP